MTSRVLFVDRLQTSVEAARSVLCVDLKLDYKQIERVHKSLMRHDSATPEGHLELYARFSERAVVGVPLSMAAPLPHQKEPDGVGTFVVNHPHLGQQVRAMSDGTKLMEWEHKAIEINERGRAVLGQSGASNLGVCVTATTREFARMRELLPDAWFLVEERDDKFLAAVDAVLGVNPKGSGVLVSYSRSVLYRSTDIRGLTAGANLSLNHGLSFALEYLKTI